MIAIYSQASFSAIEENTRGEKLNTYSKPNFLGISEQKLIHYNLKCFFFSIFTIRMQELGILLKIRW